jgi:hypothetical protein
MADPKIDPQRFAVITSALDDYRKVIAAAKSQRWEVFKWAMALELSFATAVVALHNISKPLPSEIVVGVACFVAGAALMLVLHYNSRADGARAEAKRLQRKLTSVFDLSSITRPTGNKSYRWLYYVRKACPRPSRWFYYDCQEICIFGFLLVIAAALVSTLPFFLPHVVNVAPVGHS